MQLDHKQVPTAKCRWDFERGWFCPVCEKENTEFSINDPKYDTPICNGLEITREPHAPLGITHGRMMKAIARSTVAPRKTRKVAVSVSKPKPRKTRQVHVKVSKPKTRKTDIPFVATLQ